MVRARYLIVACVGLSLAGLVGYRELRSGSAPAKEGSARPLSRRSKER